MGAMRYIKQFVDYQKREARSEAGQPFKAAYVEDRQNDIESILPLEDQSFPDTALKHCLLSFSVTQTQKILD